MTAVCFGLKSEHALWLSLCQWPRGAMPRLRPAFVAVVREVELLQLHDARVVGGTRRRGAGRHPGAKCEMLKFNAEWHDFGSHPIFPYRQPL